MKLESTLNFRADLLYVAPLFNALLLLLLYFLVNSSLVVRSGVRVDLPVSGSSLKSMQNAHVVTITTGPQGPIVLFNETQIATGDLPAQLAAGRNISRNIIVNADANAPQGMTQRVLNEIIAAGCDAFLGTRPATE